MRGIPTDTLKPVLYSTFHRGHNKCPAPTTASDTNPAPRERETHQRPHHRHGHPACRCVTPRQLVLRTPARREVAGHHNAAIRRLHYRLRDQEVMQKAQEIFRREFPGLAASGSVEFKRKKKPSLNGYQLRLVKSPRCNNSLATTIYQESRWGFRQTGRKLLLIISPH